MNTDFVIALEAVCDKIGLVVDWTSENIIPQLQTLFEKYAHYLYNQYMFMIGLSIPMLILGFSALIVCFRVCKKSDSYSGWYWTTNIGMYSSWFIIIGFILGVIGIILLPVGIYHVMQIQSVPEVYIIKDIMNMVSNGR